MPRSFDEERPVSSTETDGQPDIHMKRMASDLYLTPHTKNELNMGQRPKNESTEIIKLRRKKDNLRGLGLSSGVSDRTPKAQSNA